MKKLLFAIRDAMNGTLTKLVSVTKDKETGKTRFLPHYIIKRLWWTFAVAFLAVIIGLYANSNSTIPLNEFARLDAKLRGGGSNEGSFSTSIFDKDPGTGLSPQQTGTERTSLVDSGTSPSLSNMPDPDSIGVFGRQVADAAECTNLISKIKKGEALIGADKERLKSCLETNAAKLSKEELAQIRALASDDITGGEREALLKGLNATSDDAEAINAKNLGKAISEVRSPDTSFSELKDILVKAIEDGDIEAINAVKNRALGLPMTSKERELLDRKLASVPARANSTKDAAKSLRENSEKQGRQKALGQLANQIKEEERKLQRLKDEAEQFRKANEAALVRAAKGEGTARDVEASKAAADRQAQVLKLEGEQNERKQLFTEEVTQMEREVYSLRQGLNEEIPTGMFMYEIDENGNRVAVAPTGPMVTSKPKPSAKKPGPTVTKIPAGSDAYRIDRDDMFEFSRIQKSMQGSKRYGRRASIGDKDKDKFDPKNLIQDTQKSKSIELPPGVKIVARLNSKIMVTSNGGQRVSIKIMQDIHHPKTGVLVIPSGSEAVAKTNGFDADLGIMALKISEVNIGQGEVVEISLNVGSADGSDGLKGEVYDTKGKYYLGAFVATFTSGVLGFFSQNVIADYQASRNAVDVIAGSGLAGTAQVAKEIAETFARDMQNAPYIFHAPKGIDVVLYGGK